MPPVPAVLPVTETGRPRWSVVIPVHDCAGYLAEALPEVLAQLGGDVDAGRAEVVVVDDASADDPAAVVGRLGRGRVRYEGQAVNRGAIGTFNHCLDLASGELVHLLHGDDLVLPGFYDAVEDALDDDPAAVAAVCRVEDVTADGRPTDVTRSYRRGTGRWTGALGSLAVSNRVRAPGVVVRRSAYEAVGGFSTDLPHAADWEMWARLAAHGPVVFVDEVLARYRRHDASDTSTRVQSGENVRERVTALTPVLAHVAPERRGALRRRALAYAAVFAGRTALQLARRGRWAGAARQARESVRCLALLVRPAPTPDGEPSPTPR
ncbi:glycosyltransferase [Microlunatus flavus]|uniref:Glycosyltransferase involved in cell wall bisynthesis n=1 Tax=Microlunatus flavus TaxID=1036181 RepID=A0A1H8Z375_9ACTN|nr:glycosyltransferase [Microlunatus flavus]SEP58894.1 Glycosyltransferase involved in cell wall bisynthesis [Microlunatus flavus]